MGIRFYMTSAFVSLSLFSFSARGEQISISPSGERTCLLYYQMAGKSPPVDDFVTNLSSRSGANEFQKAAQLAQLKQRVLEEFAEMKGVKTIVVNINMSFGQYDPDLKEYTLDGFSADEHIDYQCFGTYVQLRLENAPYVQSWAMDSTAAERVLYKNQGSRDVVAVTTIDLKGVEGDGVGGEPKVIVGLAREVKIIGRYRKISLGSYTVPSK